MKLTLCRMCIQTNKLCPSCQKNMIDGVTTEVDILIGDILMNLAKSNKYLNDLTVLRIVPTENNIVVVVKRGHLAKIEKAGKHIAEKLKDKDHRKVHYVEKTKSPKTMLEKILAPVKIVSNSTVLLPWGGEKELKIQLKQGGNTDSLLDIEETSTVTHALFGLKAHYVFV